MPSGGKLPAVLLSGRTDALAGKYSVNSASQRDEVMLKNCMFIWYGLHIVVGMVNNNFKQSVKRVDKHGSIVYNINIGLIKHYFIKQKG